MPVWVNAFDRIPEKYGKYHVKLNGVKEVIRQEEFDRMKERYDSVVWLDESIDAKPLSTVKSFQELIELKYGEDKAIVYHDVKPKEALPSLISEIIKGRISDSHFKHLSNLFGIKKANAIKKKCIKKSKHD